MAWTGMNFLQSFRNSTGIGAPGEIDEEKDLISSLAYDGEGEFLAAGDRGGRITVLQRNAEKPKAGAAKYHIVTQFQSHDCEFDYLRSAEIPEVINSMSWLRSVNNSQFLLSTNDKSIKLWRLRQRRMFAETEMPYDENGVPKAGVNDCQDIGNIFMPSTATEGFQPVATTSQVFLHGHAYHINSVSVCNDCETFISACDLRVNIWSLENPLKTFQLVDLKPPAMSELSEVITGAAAHPQYGHIVGYATSRGTVNIVDTRMQARGDAGAAAMTFSHPLDPNLDQYDAEILSSVCDFSFAPGGGGINGGGGNGSLLVARDFLSMKLYDMRRPTSMAARSQTRGQDQAVAVLEVQTHLQSRLHALIEQELVFERFECTVSPCGSRIATGCFSDVVCIFNDANAGSGSTMDIEADTGASTEANRSESSAAARKNAFSSISGSKDGKGWLWPRRGTSGGSMQESANEAKAAAEIGDPSWQPCQRFRVTSNRSGRVEDIRRRDPQSEISCRVSSAQWSPDGATVAFTTANRLFLYDVSR